MKFYYVVNPAKTIVYTALPINLFYPVVTPVNHILICFHFKLSSTKSKSELPTLQFPFIVQPAHQSIF